MPGGWRRPSGRSVRWWARGTGAIAVPARPRGRPRRATGSPWRDDDGEATSLLSGCLAMLCSSKVLQSIGSRRAHVALGPWLVALRFGGSSPISPPCAGPVAGMACVEAGAFVRGDDSIEAATPREAVWLSTYYIDVYEVTNADYRGCVAAGACAPAGPRYAGFDRDQLPVQGISWFDADRYCQAAGKRLPTEAQWEKAARGTEGATYPWGNQPATCERAVFADRSGRGCGRAKRGAHPETGQPWPVGSRPAGVYGLHDMAGNAYEWVADWGAPSYGACGEACRGIDPRGPCAGESVCAAFPRKVVRGGSWYWGPGRAKAASRRFHVPDNQPFHHFGFRCAATPEQARRLGAGSPPGRG
ncbi:MAG: formylglycine-generating enzyme family protein [Myxococcales bacterium FL481]|nr:MAG: formylglycine-generating enzyme family protein [Myxococcales bacterium FL481]